MSQLFTNVIRSEAGNLSSVQESDVNLNYEPNKYESNLTMELIRHVKISNSLLEQIASKRK
jgi:hypothetical protein